MKNLQQAYFDYIYNGCVADDEDMAEYYNEYNEEDLYIDNKEKGEKSYE